MAKAQVTTLDATTTAKLQAELATYTDSAELEKLAKAEKQGATANIGDLVPEGVPVAVGEQKVTFRNMTRTTFAHKQFRLAAVAQFGAEVGELMDKFFNESDAYGQIWVGKV